MAESFLFSIAESLAAKLASRAFEEASQVLGVYGHLKEFKETLSLVKAVLLDAEQKQEQNHELREWLRQIKRVFYDAEDVLDEFECQTLRKQVIKAHGTTKSKVGHFFSTSNPLIFRYKMAQQIKDINKRLDKVADDRRKFGLQIIDIDRRVVHRRELTYSNVIDSNVIGREHDKEKIIDLLMQQNPNNCDTNLSVIPIVGMGGLGKTTLAKFVFNDKRTDECFPLKMWVCVSDDFDIKQLIIKIINSPSNLASVDALPGQQNLNMLDPEPLQNQLKNKLIGQKFLLVLDDVWNESRVKWIELKNLLQVGAVGSKILVTTRSHKIASIMGTVPSHILEGLSQKDALSLFVKWAFKEEDEEKHPHLINIGREIVARCKGVPLALRTLGSLLYSKYEANEWEYVRNNGIWNIQQEKDDILPALKLSYDLMPPYLKQCFALFSLYPKDYEFNSSELIALWGALGFLDSPKNNKIPEEVANQYLYELLSRSFLEDVFNFSTMYSFKIYDLVHDLALFVANDECQILNSHLQNISDNVRHLSFTEKSLFGNLNTTRSAAVRTIMFAKEIFEETDDEALINICVSKFKYLRFLDLSYSTCVTLPRSIGKLKHLRCINISANQCIKRLPNSICKLQNLQSLILGACTELEALPEGLRKLISLRHFYITTKQSVLPLNELTNLSLLTIMYSHNLESIFGGGKFPYLKTLSIFSCEGLKFMSMDVKDFPELETLSLYECYHLDLEVWKNNHQEQSPRLKLKCVNFVKLSQLVVLPQWLQETAHSLQSLTVIECDNLELLPEWLLSLTNLKTLGISDCPKILSLPDNISQLTALESLMIEDCPELCRKCQPNVGEFWPKISHIKHVYVAEPNELEEEEEELQE
ncbi:hypothetical protein Fmac_029744 [Flemingia macrophylla]|uniref:Uncharacterized protein n=1 Tax=Flemingia macrophylla TaxID=520843 RepID=A0ABD1LB73_9FABA